LINFILQNIRKRFGKDRDMEPQDPPPDISPATKESGTEKQAFTADTGDSKPPAKKRRPRSRRRRKPSQPESRGTAPAVERDEAEQAGPHDWDPSRFQVEPVEGKKRFHDFNLPPEILHAIADLGFRYCTPIQADLLVPTLQGSDAAGRAQTGTGKTAVFLIGILSRFLQNPPLRERKPGRPRALILGPTRELVLQIEKDARDLSKYMDCRIVSVFGGMDYEKQRRALSGPVDVIMATPGRLLDFKRRGEVDLGGVEVLVIDEADRMLDMGFIPDTRHIIHSTPPKKDRQTMLFSATLTPEVTRLSAQWTRDPVVVEIEPEQVAVDTVEQVVYITTIREKFSLLYNLVTRQNLERVIVFTNRKDETRKVAEKLAMYGINCDQLTGDVTQKKRIRTLEDFREGKIRVLVATDVVGRGLHVESISHVVNYNLPINPEDYVHRIGRTGRAGATGISVSFATEDDAFQLPCIEEFIGKPLPCVHPEEEWLELPPPPERKGPSRESRRRRPPQSRSRPRRARRGS